MRLRRETGDFNLVFDWTKEQYTCQIRKGLSAEDLVGGHRDTHYKRKR